MYTSLAYMSLGILVKEQERVATLFQLGAGSEREFDAARARADNLAAQLDELRLTLHQGLSRLQPHRDHAGRNTPENDEKR